MNWEKIEAMKVGQEGGHCFAQVGNRRLESYQKVFGGEAEIKGRRGRGLPRKEWNATFKQ